jgi:N-acyl-D-aspartate/D-glutamate deacylase
MSTPTSVNKKNDLLICHGTVIDDNRQAHFQADDAAIDDMIADIGKLARREAGIVVDARNKIVAPASSTCIGMASKQCCRNRP